MLYSTTGLYFLMDGTDKTLTATMNEDFMDLWNEDVFEVFLWTDERHPVYFEYRDLAAQSRAADHRPQLRRPVPGLAALALRRRPPDPQEHQHRRRTEESRAAIDGWRAEFFIPYALLQPLQNVPPKPGTVWRANFYRMDYDGGKRTQWEWAPVGESFHEYQKFGDLVFAER